MNKKVFDTVLFLRIGEMDTALIGVTQQQRGRISIPNPTVQSLIPISFVDFVTVCTLKSSLLCCIIVFQRFLIQKFIRFSVSFKKIAKKNFYFI